MHALIRVVCDTITASMRFQLKETCGMKNVEKLGRGKLFIRQVRTRARGSFVNKHTGSLNEFELIIGSVDRDFEHGDIF